jgi:hypothetical protein
VIEGNFVDPTLARWRLLGIVGQLVEPQQNRGFLHCLGGADNSISLKEAVMNVEGFSRDGGMDVTHRVKQYTSKMVGSICIGVPDGVVVENPMWNR